MPTNTQRLQTLVRAGLLPETAQDIVDFGAELPATVTARDQARARVFVLYSPLIPDRARLLWNAAEMTQALAEANG